MLKDAEVTGKRGHEWRTSSASSPVETLDSDTDITDASFLDEAYGEENAGA